MAAALEQDVLELLSKQSLHELNMGYCRAVDRLDEAAFLALFHDDAMIDSGVVRGAPGPFARRFIEWVRAHARVIVHQITNERFVIDGARARGESSVIAISRLLGAPADSDVLTFGRYLDHFEQRAGAWKFLQRRFVLDHSVAWPCDAALPTAGLSVAARGGYAPDDPSYTFWATD